MALITWDDFAKVELRVGTIIAASDFPKARKPAYKLSIDLGPDIGLKQSSAQITQHYTLDELVGRQVLCVCNFPPKQIGPFVSEVLTTGVNDDQGRVVLLHPSHRVPNGTKLY